MYDFYFLNDNTYCIFILCAPTSSVLIYNPIYDLESDVLLEQSVLRHEAWPGNELLFVDHPPHCHC